MIDAIPENGFNPVWEEVQITFTAGNTPRLLFSDDEIAAAAASGEITLTSTGEVYWCPVVGLPPITVVNEIAARSSIRLAAAIVIEHRQRGGLTICFQKRAFFQLLEGAAQLFLRVHDDRSIPRDRFFERFAGDEQEANSVLTRLYFHFIAAVEKDE